MRTPMFHRILIGAGFVTLLGGPALAILPTDFVAMRILEPPAVHPPIDCLDFIEGEQDCGAGPARVVGVSNAGDIFGILQTNHPHKHHDEEAIRWLRSTAYTGDNVRRPEMSPGFIDEAGNLLPGGRTKGFHMEWVTSGGFATGRANTTNTDAMYYDIVNDEWFYLGQGDGYKGNNHGQMVVDHWPRLGLPPRVADISLLEDPLAQGNLGTVYSFEDGFHPRAINDNGVIVGSNDAGDPIKIEPVPGAKGENGLPVWGEPVAMEEIGPSFASGDVVDLSNSDPPIAIGRSTGFDGVHGVVWNVADGTVIADLGVGVFPRHHGQFSYKSWAAINGEGTIIVSQQAQLTSFPPTFEEFIWWSNDGWQTVNKLGMDEVLKVVPGGEHWARITSLTGVNDAGQITGQGLLHDVLASGEDELLTAWNRDLATSDDCVGGIYFLFEDGCGIPFLLDTMELVGGVIKGDVNNDGVANFVDITPFINAQSAVGDEGAFLLLTPDGCFLCADIDMDGAVDFLDITPYINLLDQMGAAAVPEPTAMALLAIVLWRPRHRPKMKSRVT